MKRHHDQGHAYEGEHLIGDLLRVLEGGSVIIMAGGGQARHWAVAESFIS